jgi:Zn-dependent M28 family amino/carboxypeptidase
MAHQKALTMFVDHFDSLGAQIEQQKFSLKDPYSSDTLHLTNIIARFNPNRKNRLLFCAHWDCRPRCDEDPDTSKRGQQLTGANDGASGVAVLLQLAVHIAELKTDRGIDLVLFDGEDWGREGDHEFYLLGSRHFARSVNPDLYDYAVVIDLVGDRDLKFYREGLSVRYHPDLVERLWDRATDIGLGAWFDDRVTREVLDDHVPLLGASIPAVDIIDFEYPWWHTTADTPDKCSPEALAVTGQLLLSLIEDPL